MSDKGFRLLGQGGKGKSRPPGLCQTNQGHLRVECQQGIQGMGGVSMLWSPFACLAPHEVMNSLAFGHQFGARSSANIEVNSSRNQIERISTFQSPMAEACLACATHYDYAV
jgi:hypothetical protein